MVKGMIVLLKRILSGREPEEIVNAELYFIDKAGLKESCAPARINDLFKLINKMKQDAAFYQRNNKI